MALSTEIKIALPKGRLMADTSSLLDRACWGLGDYHEGTRSYRLTCQRFPGLKAKVFNEKDIPIQVAVGNYDLGICGLDWVEELLARYPSAAIVKVADLGYGEGALSVVAARNGQAPGVGELPAMEHTVRLASEYPNLAEAFALRLRLKRFSVFPLWGAAEVYPPESAELALLAGKRGSASFGDGLSQVSTILNYSACLIANRDRWEAKDLGDVLASIEQALHAEVGSLKPAPAFAQPEQGSEVTGSLSPPSRFSLLASPSPVRLALPDGHQQGPAVALLTKAGIVFDDYPSATGNRRPASESLPGVSVKVIRPQDMPQQVAAGNFDIAITGIDWLKDHLYQFPSSPATAILDLGFARVRIVAVVSNDLPVSNGYELKEYWAARGRPVRLAAEYVNIADKYARDNHFGRYRIIPTWGATEAFVPEDADLLIENTETGRTIARHNLKIIDTLFESTGHLIGNRDSLADPNKHAIIESFVHRLTKAMGK